MTPYNGFLFCAGYTGHRGSDRNAHGNPQRHVVRRGPDNGAQPDAYRHAEAHS